jgi:hypothetical protein
LAGISCQRVINVDIGSATGQLVIEGNLNNQLGTQTVTISRSVPYSAANVFPTVSGAIVTFTDALANTYKLTEIRPGIYTINNFKGKQASLYLLTVQLNGQTYVGGSIMPLQVNVDSLSLVSQVFGNRSVKTVVVNYVDPAKMANQYRFVMYVNGVQVKRVFVENDQFSDGRAVSSMLYQRDIDLKKGDKVDVDMECIDPEIYNYWYSLSNQGGNTPQDSATPANPPSNINNGALGYFSAHTIQRKTILIP